MKHHLRRMLPAPLKARLETRGIAMPASDALNVVDPTFYARTPGDIAQTGVDPTLHFRRHGAGEGRIPNAFFTPSYVLSRLDQDTHRGENPVAAYTASGLAQKPRLVFVSHDASRTGAPAIILRLLDMFSKSGLFECFTILGKGGDRAHEFEALSHTYTMRDTRNWGQMSHDDAYAELAPLFHASGVFEGNVPVCALVNSAESYRLGHALDRLGVPVVSLIHEIAAYYPQQVFEEIARYSRKVVFPSQFVSRAADRYCALDMSRTTVRGQGLLEDDFGKLDQTACRRVLREALEVEADAFIVLNVGTLGIRKGPDMFVDIARIFFAGSQPERPVHFVWFGAPDEDFTYPHDFIERHGLQDRVHILPATSEIEQVFLGGDVFLMTSRADPFPCVVHEAMACGLPVVAFRNGGGAPELIGQDCGAIVDMGDLKSAADALHRFMDKPDLRDQQGRRARDRIAQDWDYFDYLQDIYKIIQSSAQIAPRGGWPVIPAQAAEPHLVVMRGCHEDLEVLVRTGLADPDAGCLITVIDGRFGPDADAVVGHLRDAGVRYRICQPRDDSDPARTEALATLLSNPKPRRLTMINTLHHLPMNRLKTLALPKIAILSGFDLPADVLHTRLPYLDRLCLRNGTIHAQVLDLNPNAAEVLRDTDDLPAAISITPIGET